MGSTSYSARDWAATSTVNARKSVDEIFTAKSVDPKNDVKNITIRESRDSEAHPITIPIYFNVDGSGSMGHLSLLIARKVGLIYEELLKVHAAGGIPYPQVGVGIFRDVIWDSEAFYQTSQFESDTGTLMAQVEKFAYVGTGGGRNSSESEGLVWYMAASKVIHDHGAKRGKKGILITAGDEGVPLNLRPQDIQRAFGEDVQHVATNKELLDALSLNWDVFHIMIAEGNHMKYYKDRVVKEWTDLLGQRAILLNSTDAMVETVVSLTRLMAGETVEAATSSWSGGTAIAVKDAVKGVLAPTASRDGAVVRL